MKKEGGRILIYYYNKNKPSDLLSYLITSLSLSYSKKDWGLRWDILLLI